MTMWYSLDKKNKINRQGILKVRVAFGTEKNNQVAEQEYRHMLRIILLHELEVSKVNKNYHCLSCVEFKFFIIYECVYFVFKYRVLFANVCLVYNIILFTLEYTSIISNKILHEAMLSLYCLPITLRL